MARDQLDAKMLEQTEVCDYFWNFLHTEVVHSLSYLTVSLLRIIAGVILSVYIYAKKTSLKRETVQILLYLFK
jgi:hypothetical protein